MRNDKTLAQLNIISVISVVVAFFSSWYLHDIFYGPDSTRFRSIRIAPAVGIIQILVGQAIKRRMIRAQGEETDDQATLFDFFAGLWSAICIGLGVIMADVLRPTEK